MTEEICKHQWQFVDKEVRHITTKDCPEIVYRFICPTCETQKEIIKED